LNQVVVRVFTIRLTDRKVTFVWDLLQQDQFTVNLYIGYIWGFGRSEHYFEKPPSLSLKLPLRVKINEAFRR
jgi:hypothetical protein